MTQFDIPSVLPLPARMVGERVVARPYARGDGPAVYDGVRSSLADLTRWLPWPETHTSEAFSEGYARRVRARWSTREDLAVALCDHDGRLVGGSGLHNIDWNLRAFEIGYWLRTDAVGRGFVSDAVKLLTALAFARLDARRVLIRCDSRNARSAAVPRRLGFLHEGTLRRSRLANDGSGPTDTLEFGLIPEDLGGLSWYPDALARVLASDLDG